MAMSTLVAAMACRCGTHQESSSEKYFLERRLQTSTLPVTGEWSFLQRRISTMLLLELQGADTLEMFDPTVIHHKFC